MGFFHFIFPDSSPQPSRVVDEQTWLHRWDDNPKLLAQRRNDDAGFNTSVALVEKKNELGQGG